MDKDYFQLDGKQQKRCIVYSVASYCAVNNSFAHLGCGVGEKIIIGG